MERIGREKVKGERVKERGGREGGWRGEGERVDGERVKERGGREGEGEGRERDGIPLTWSSKAVLSSHRAPSNDLTSLAINSRK